MAKVGQRVESRSAIFVGGAPRGADPLLLFQPLQSQVERAVIDKEHLIGLALNGARDPLAMLRPKHENSENQQVERALKKGSTLPIVA
jgi:hypothetical protein